MSCRGCVVDNLYHRLEYRRSFDGSRLLIVMYFTLKTCHIIMLRIVSLTPLTDVLVLSMVLYSRFMIRFFKSLFGRCLKGLLKTCFSQTDGLVFCLCPTNMSIIPSQDLPISYEQKNDILDMFCFCCIDSTIQPRLICTLSILSSHGYTFHRFENHALFYVG